MEELHAAWNVESNIFQKKKKKGNQLVILGEVHINYPVFPKSWSQKSGIHIHSVT